MAIGIHQNNAAGKIAISSDGDFFADSELAVMANLRVIADFKQRSIRKPGGKRDCDLAIESDIVAKDDISRALDIMHVTIGAQISPVFRAVGFEQRLAHEHAQGKLIALSERQEQPQYRLHHGMRRRHAE
jgi:hypothetical protein